VWLGEHAFTVRYGAPSWSPDGRAVAFVATGDLYVTHLGGRTTMQTDLARQGVREPIWSPDGTKIAFDVCEQGEVNPYCFVSHT
jgi:Tol biopolymer transport system component